MSISNRSYRNDDSKFFERTRETGLVNFLSSRGVRACIITPYNLPNEKASPDYLFKLVKDYKGQRLNCSNVFVHHPKDEKHIVKTISQKQSKLNVYSIQTDIIPMLLANLKTPKDLNQAKESKHPSTKYVIFSTPRSGSTWLCNLLQQVGLGRPKEHLRYPIVYMWQNKTFRPAAFMNTLLHCGQHNGVFGTKIISHFLITAFPNLTAQQLLLHWLKRADFKFIYLERQDKVAQAISVYFAKNLERWHIRQNVDQSTSISKLPYNHTEILKYYNDLIREEEILKQLFNKFSQSVLNVIYEELNTGFNQQFERITNYLGIKLLPEQIKQLTQETQGIKQISKTDPLMQEYCDRFSQDIQKSKTRNVGGSIRV